MCAGARACSAPASNGAKMYSAVFGLGSATTSLSSSSSLWRVACTASAVVFARFGVCGVADARARAPLPFTLVLAVNVVGVGIAVSGVLDAPAVSATSVVLSFCVVTLRTMRLAALRKDRCIGTSGSVVLGRTRFERCVGRDSSCDRCISQGEYRACMDTAQASAATVCDCLVGVDDDFSSVLLSHTQSCSLSAQSCTAAAQRSSLA